MSCYNILEEERRRTGKLQGGVRLIDDKNGAVAGCCIGVTHSERKEMGRQDVHDDQEGFLVWKGTGTARIGEETVALKPGVAIIVPAGVGHAMCCGEDSEFMETIWFHSATPSGKKPGGSGKCYSALDGLWNKGILLDENNGCVDGCCAGISWYENREYSAGGCHEDQEGFFVLEGSGFAKVGDEEFPVAPGTAFIAPAHTLHTLRRDESCSHVAVFWFHSAL